MGERRPPRIQPRQGQGTVRLPDRPPRRGADHTGGVQPAVEDGVYNIARKNYFQTIVHDLRSTLRQAGIEYILVKSHNSISVRADEIDCDSYRFLDGEPQAVNSYRHNYLPSYSWAEFSVGKMEGL